MQNLSITFNKLNEKTRFILVGSFGTVLVWITYNLLYYLLHPNDSIAWSISYIFGVTQQHTLHRNFTFSTSLEPFFPELGKSYFAYSFGLLISSCCYFYLNNMLSLDHQISWLISTGVSVFSNYISLKVFVFKTSSV